MDVGEGMRVFFDVGFRSNGISRVAFNLAKYLPEHWEVATGSESADLTVIHVRGRHDHVANMAARIKAEGRQYAIIQYVLESCKNPDPKDWLTIWGGAKVVWSYYNLHQYVPELYFAPLAADPKLFYREDEPTSYLVGCNGEDYRAECLAEVRTAAFGLGKVLHVGPDFAADPNVTALQNITDAQFRKAYNQCEWFSALRRKDGFEMVAVEALLCGARPILFDAPRFRTWFDGLAEFIPEGTPAEVVSSLKELFQRGPRPVTDDEIAETKARFDWSRICGEFWSRCA